MTVNLPYLKTAVAFAGALAESLLVYADDNQISNSEIPLIIAGTATLIGVFFFPNVRNGENVDAIARNVQRNTTRNVRLDE